MSSSKSVTKLTQKLWVRIQAKIWVCFRFLSYFQTKSIGNTSKLWLVKELPFTKSHILLCNGIRWSQGRNGKPLRFAPVGIIRLSISWDREWFLKRELVLPSWIVKSLSPLVLHVMLNVLRNSFIYETSLNWTSFIELLNKNYFKKINFSKHKWKITIY